ncbi:MAG TPA: PAS domain-containing protein [Armatimonadota bacterium]|jgi:DUF438 domain-containing protein
MNQVELLTALLDSLDSPYVFADTDHVIRYMNRRAVEHYAARGGADLVGQSLFACHNEQSAAVMREVLAALAAGEEERMITDGERFRAYMRAVRGPRGELLGYFERYEPPRGA